MALADQVQVDLSSIANGAWCNVGGGPMFGCSTLPTGTLTANGSVFNIAGANGGNNAWFSSVAANNGAGTVSVTIPINVVGATTVSTLMNTFWGQAAAEDVVTFTGSAGAIYSVNLVGNQNIRDYNNYVWTNSISGTTTNAWNNNNGQRLDEQIFNLPSEFADQTLESMSITDSGNQVSSRVFLAGLTVDPGSNAMAVPEPASLALVGGVLMFAGLVFRRRRAQARA
jgi:hypothetical protein